MVKSPYKTRPYRDEQAGYIPIDLLARKQNHPIHPALRGGKADGKFSALFSPAIPDPPPGAGVGSYV